MTDMTDIPAVPASGRIRLDLDDPGQELVSTDDEFGVFAGGWAPDVTLADAKVVMMGTPRQSAALMGAMLATIEARHGAGVLEAVLEIMDGTATAIIKRRHEVLQERIQGIMPVPNAPGLPEAN